MSFNQISSESDHRVYPGENDIIADLGIRLNNDRRRFYPEAKLTAH